MTTWLRMLLAELPLLRDLPDFGDRPLPRVRVLLGPSVPGWLLTGAAALAAAVSLTVATQRAAVYPPFGWAVVVVAAAVMALWPSTGTAHIVVVLSGFLVALDGRGPFDPVVFALIPLAYVTVRLAWWAERVSWIARVEWAALARGLGRGLAIIAGTLGFAGVAFLIAGRPSALWLVAGGAAVVGIVWLVLAARRA